MKGHVISLSIGEPDFVTPWSIREAGINSLIDGYTHYSPNSGYIDSRTAIADYLKRRYGVAYDPAHEILITVGGSEGLDLVARALINPGDEVVVVEPCFVAYKATVEFAHGVPVVVSTKPENDYRLMPEELEAAITDKTKYIIVGYPNNPTGAVMTLEDWAKIKDVLLRHPDIIVLSDELYCELNYLDGKPADPALDIDKKIDILEEQLRINVERIDEPRGIIHTRRHLAASPIFKGIPDFRQTRIAMLRASKMDELMEIIENTRKLLKSINE
jgi:aminotransferase